MAAETKKSNTIFFIVLITVLVITNGLLFYSYQQTKRDKVVLKVELRETKEIKAQLEEEYRVMERQLAGYKGQNEEMDSMLSQAESKMADLKGRIDVLLRKGRVTVAELSKARQQIQELKKMRDHYIAEMDSLVEVNQLLSVENETLVQRLDVEREFTKQLQEEKHVLAEKVNIGSILKALDILATGVKVRSSGKEVVTSNAKKAEKIKVCFDIEENKIADPGKKTILLRIINPEGATIAIQDRGSGVFKLAESGDENQFTIGGSTNYENKRKRVCMEWAQDMPFTQGKYIVELYQQGYLIGTSSFALKGGIL